MSLDLTVCAADSEGLIYVHVHVEVITEQTIPAAGSSTHGLIRGQLVLHQADVRHCTQI